MSAEGRQQVEAKVCVLRNETQGSESAITYKTEFGMKAYLSVGYGCP